MSVITKALLVGLAAGIVGGLFGVGGGVLIVPVLVLWMAVPPHRAVASSLAAIVATAAAGSVRFGLSDAIDPATAAWLFGGAGAGALLGARLSGRLSEVWLTRAFVAVALVAAARLAVSG